jgi:hypothetical protein
VLPLESNSIAHPSSTTVTRVTRHQPAISGASGSHHGSCRHDAPAVRASPESITATTRRFLSSAVPSSTVPRDQLLCRGDRPSADSAGHATPMPRCRAVHAWDNGCTLRRCLERRGLPRSARAQREHVALPVTPASNTTNRDRPSNPANESRIAQTRAVQQTCGRGNGASNFDRNSKNGRDKSLHGFIEELEHFPVISTANSDTEVCVMGAEDSLKSQNFCLELKKRLKILWAANHVPRSF